jgi:hypothetical protein
MNATLALGCTEFQPRHAHRLVNRLADRIALLGRCLRELVDQRDLIDAVFYDHDKLIACVGRR